MRDARAVVMGASAGGVEAISTLLAAIPAHWRPPVMVVVHLPPARPSGLAALLARRCALPVREAEDKMPLMPATVVVAPPDYHLLVERGSTLALSAEAPVRFSRPAIDPLFESAAAAFGAGLLAILLTGASDDGSAGLSAVRRAGGTAWVQDPDDARVPVMPAAALAHAGADAVLTLRDMAQWLAKEPT